MQDKDEMLAPGLEQEVAVAILKGLRKIDAANLSPEPRRQLDDFRFVSEHWMTPVSKFAGR
jgi:hypothetical protein